jgi:predicted dehydrogenase
MVEKPMADTYENARNMLAVAEENNVRLMINFPLMHERSVMSILDIVSKGVLGNIWMFKWRMGHGGAEKQKELTDYFISWLHNKELNGGGALADFCCYSACLLASILGKPNRISAMADTLKKEFLEVEDNAVVCAKYDEKKALAVLEGTWSQDIPLSGNAIYGDRGCISNNPMEPNDFYIRMNDETEWRKIDLLEVDAAENTSGKMFINRLRSNQPFTGMADPNNALIAQAIIEAAYKSIDTGSTVEVCS